MFRRIHIRGWRSFESGHGIDLDGLGTSALLVGANDVGKSNVFRFLNRMSEGFHKLSEVGEGAWFGARVDLTDEDLWMQTGGFAEADLVMDRHWLNGVMISNAKQYDEDLRLHVRITKERFEFSPVTASGEFMLRYDVKRAEIGVRQLDSTYKPNGFEDCISWLRPLVKMLGRNIIYVDPRRESREQLAKGPGRFGDETVADLRKFRLQRKPKDWTILCRMLEQHLSALLGEPVKFDLRDDDLFIEQRRSGEGIPIRWRELGAGVAQAIVLLVLVILRGNGARSLLLLDEPEASLHPAAAAELIRILQEVANNSTFMIATHSSFIMDHVPTSWSTLRIARNSAGSSFAAQISGSHDRRALLDELGIRPSHLFLANSTIWVEGPSDAIYLRRLLREIEPSLLEGRDYAFVCYGGALISAITLDEEEMPSDKVVDLFRVSHRPILLADRDKGDDEPLKKHVCRLLALAENLQEQQSIAVLPVREIENFLSAAGLAVGFVEAVSGHLRGDQQRALAVDATALVADPATSFVERLLLSSRIAGVPIEDPEDRKRVTKRIRAAKVPAALAVQASASSTRSLFEEPAFAFARDLVKRIGR
jgi:hypothetical protein